MKLLGNYYIVKQGKEKNYPVVASFTGWEDIRRICIEIGPDNRERVKGEWENLLLGSGLMRNPYPYLPEFIWKMASNDEVWEFCKGLFRVLLGTVIVKVNGEDKYLSEEQIDLVNIETIIKKLKNEEQMDL